MATTIPYNGGQSWNGGENLSGTVGAGDPVIAFDPDGTAYLLYQIITASGLYLVKSLDGGVTWSSPTTVFQVAPTDGSVDRPWMAVSPVRNANGKFDVYISYTFYLEPPQQGVLTPSDIKLLKSTDGGIGFSVIHTAPAVSNFVQGSSVAVGANGEVFLSWAELSSVSTAVTSIAMEKSADGGTTFSSLNAVTAYQIGAKSGNDFTLKTPKIRVDSYPRLAVDPSPGIYRGYAYVVWAGKQSSSGNPDILIVRWKKNAGGNFEWSGVEIVDQATSDQWMPAISVSPDGVVSTLYYSSQTGASDPIYTYLKTSTNGGQSFSGVVNIGTTMGFTIEPTGNTFLGDYHGVASWFGKAFALWCENRDHGSNNKRQAYFRALNVTELTPTGYQYVTVDQIDAGNQSFEKFGRWNQNAFTNHKAPFRFLFQTNANEIVRAKQDFKIGTTQKYNKWDADNNVVNHRTFTITSGLIALKAQFQNANNATIRTELVEGGAGGNVEFRDPWLIDDLSDPKGARNRGANAIWYTKTSPFSPNTSEPNYKGVFLNQDPNTTPNYYSTRVSSSQSINGFTWLFQKWTATSATLTQPTNTETPVVFTATNADVKARYKAHLGTNSTVATAYNNQRKLVYAGTTYHLIYESAGEIYYTSSSDNGVTWSSEVWISDGNGGCKYPAIDVAPGGIIVVVWQQEFPSTGKVCMRRKTTGGWQAQQQVVSFTASSGFTATPVVTAYPAPYYFIVWHDYGTNNLVIRSYNESNGTFGTTTSIASTNSNSFYPTLAADLYTVLHLAWAESNKIYFSKISHVSGGNYTYDVNKEEVTLNYGSYTEHSFPSITTDYNRRPNIVWEAYNTVTYTRNIVHRRRETSGSWSSFTNFSPNDDEYLKPSIGSHFNIGNNNTLEAIWYVLSNNQLKLAKYNGTSWTQFTQTPTGQCPAMSQDMSAVTAKAKMAYRSVSGTPYTLATTSQNLPKTAGQSIVHHRRGVLGLGGAELVFELGEFEIGGTKVRLFSYVDTLAVGHTGKWEDMFRTESFQVTNQTNLGFSRSWTVVNPARLKSILPDNAKASFQLEVVDAPTQKALAVIDQQDITNTPALPSEEKKNVAFNLAGSKEIFLRVAWSVPAGVKAMPAMVESYRETASDSVTEKTVANSTTVQLTPTEFKLSQNYPNPFNPSTIIHFTLPEPAQVRLRILNLMGEQVRSLLVGNKSAGAFTEIWDGKNDLGKTVSSGVYISQLEVVSFAGQNRVMTKKMLLMR